MAPDGDRGLSGVTFPKVTRHGEAGVTASLAAGEDPRAGELPPKNDAKGLIRPNFAVEGLAGSLESAEMIGALLRGGKDREVLSLEMIYVGKCERNDVEAMLVGRSTDRAACRDRGSLIEVNTGESDDNVDSNVTAELRRLVSLTN